MKKMIILTGLMAVAAVTTYAKDARSMERTTIVAADDSSKTTIDPATLPDAVKTTLAGDAYKGWTISNAWIINADPVYYIVNLKKDDQVTTVNIDADGKVK